MAEYGLLKSFNIDNGELDGLSPQQCFVLGYELAILDERLEHADDGFTMTVHADNRERITASCEKSKRPYELTYCHDDVSEEWMNLVVF